MRSQASVSRCQRNYFQILITFFVRRPTLVAHTSQETIDAMLDFRRGIALIETAPQDVARNLWTSCNIHYHYATLVSPPELCIPNTSRPLSHRPLACGRIKRNRALRRSEQRIHSVRSTINHFPTIERRNKTLLSL